MIVGFSWFLHVFVGFSSFSHVFSVFFLKEGTPALPSSVDLFLAQAPQLHLWSCGLRPGATQGLKIRAAEEFGQGTRFEVSKGLFGIFELCYTVCLCVFFSFFGAKSFEIEFVGLGGTRMCFGLSKVVGLLGNPSG